MLDPDEAWALACSIHLAWDDHERELLAPLIDATIMRVDPDRLDAIARPLVVALWDGLRPLLETECENSDVAADLAAGPEESRLALAVVEQAAMDLADHTFFLEDCLDCIEEGLERRPSRALADGVAAVVALHCESAPADAPRRLRELAALGRESLPRVAAALEEVAADPDRLLRAVRNRRRAAAADLN